MTSTTISPILRNYLSQILSAYSGVQFSDEDINFTRVKEHTVSFTKMYGLTYLVTNLFLLLSFAVVFFNWPGHWALYHRTLQGLNSASHYTWQWWNRIVSLLPRAGVVFHPRYSPSAIFSWHPMSYPLMLLPLSHLHHHYQPSLFQCWTKASLMSDQRIRDLKPSLASYFHTFS